MKKGEFIGIDFGTTNTAVVQVLSDEQGMKTISLGEGGYPFSSIVAIPKNGGAPKFGREVRNRREELSVDHDIFTSMKSYLGTYREFIVGANRYTATDITSAFLKYVKAYISRHHNVEINKAGFSFPVDFSPEARRELQIAAEKAGITVSSFISEPTAAYISSRGEVQACERVMVLDWGGGTFDISVLNLKKNSVTENFVLGERIGGDDIDIELARRIHAAIAQKSGIGTKTGFDDMSPADRDLIIARCERAKIEISETDEEYDFTVRDYGEYGTKSVTISLELFNGIVKPVLKSKILRAIDTALGRTSLTPAGIDAVIIVGGSSNLTSYAEAITRLFGEEKIIFPQKPQWSAAEGAALMQIIGGNFKLGNSLGDFLSDDSVFPLLKANEHGVGSKIGPVTFSLTEDTNEAHFIFTNGDGSRVFARENMPTRVPAKGYLDEKIKLNAEIGYDQIARIEIHNQSMGNIENNPPKKVEINELTFFYDISELN